MNLLLKNGRPFVPVHLGGMVDPLFIIVAMHQVNILPVGKNDKRDHGYDEQSHKNKYASTKIELHRIKMFQILRNDKGNPLGFNLPVVFEYAKYNTVVFLVDFILRYEQDKSCLEHTLVFHEHPVTGHLNLSVM